MKNKYPFLRILGNRYFIVSILFIFWMFFLDNYSFFEHLVLDNQIEELETNKKYYKEEITSDSIKIKKLQNPDMIQKYAREKYYMKKDSEDIYIIEYEDTLQTEKSINNY